MISGWSSSALPTLQAPTGSPLEYGVITQQQASWIGGALCLGGIAGTLVGGAIVDRIGRKWTAWIAGLPLVVCWALVIVADHPGYLMGARFLGGLAGGIEFVVTPLYVSEIACTRHRGTLSSLLILSCCLGVELAYLAGALLHYHTIPWISVGVPVFFLASFCFLPETPSYLAKGEQLEAAEQSLRFFYGIQSEKDTVGQAEYVRELQLLRRIVQTEPHAAKDPATTNTVALSWSDFTSRHARLGLLICVTLMALNQFCGCFYMMNYAQSVFAESGSVLSLPASLSVIVVGLIQLVGCYVCTLLVDRSGRKILLLISSAGLTLGQSVFASYCYGQTMGLDLTAFGWVPLLCFSVIVFIGTVGVGTMPFVVLAEIMPQKYFSTLSVLLGMHGILMFFAICSLIGTLFVLLCMPETKGKSFQEIQYMMEK
uniref:Major facilitator superfamily (MFS) profile domain-containing protein n=1 Tax=Anopheles maculatus TaxID=74869 RepID=A0A182S7B0_9DIPT